MVGVPEFILNSGWKIPVIGFGTAGGEPNSDLVEVFVDAIEAGYRHFDTASVYGTEETLGKAIAEALGRGIIQSREELFITSKLWCSDAAKEFVLPAIKESLQKLGLTYLDLYLIHYPLRFNSREKTFFVPKEDLLPIDIKSTWEGMEECQRLGLARSIGVSNFSCKKIEEVLKHATIIPAVNQVEMNPTWQQRKLLEFSKEKGIILTAFSPLGACGTFWGSDKVMKDSILKEIANSKGNTVAQVALRWAYEQGVTIAVKSYNKERMRQNLQIFDWELTKEELDRISKIPQSRAVDGKAFVSPQGPYKSIEEIWDGEI